MSAESDRAPASIPRREHRRSLGELQEAILEDLWEAGESSVREVLERLRARGMGLAYTTVLTVMRRLAERGLIVRRRVGRRDLYQAPASSEALAEALSREAVDRLLAAHGEAALAAFALRVREGDPRQLARLREFLEGPE